MLIARTKKNSKTGQSRAGKSRDTKPEEAGAWRLVKAMRGPNDKYINPTDASLNTLTLTTPGIVLLNGVALGTGENARIGRLVTHKRLQLDVNLNYFGSIYYQSINYRVYVFVENTALGSQIAPSQVFVEPTNFRPWTQRDFTNRNNSRYLCLYDSGCHALACAPKASGVTAPFGSTGLPYLRNHHIDIPLNFQTDYSRGTAGTIADIDTNSLYLVVLTDNPTAGDLSMYFNYLTRFNDDS
jgi:hypothetical protein